AFGNPLEGKEPPAGYECESCIDVYYLAKIASLRSGFDISNQSIFNSERFGTTTLDYGYSFQKESVGKGDGVKYSQDDIQNNRTHRDGDRYESSVFLQAKWSPIDWLSLELGGRYSWFKVHDNNANWVEDTKKYKNITLFGDDGSSLGDVR
ncbi:TonB-dependent receptor, partial [Lactobacillus rhamnosus]|uniref:TonB-dependent receptor domain-containing protein n=1 Tax=Lacticaseibacillus rhamnosus TaxID=47715 RepID=UPI0015FCCD3D